MNIVQLGDFNAASEKTAIPSQFVVYAVVPISSISYLFYVEKPLQIGLLQFDEIKMEETWYALPRWMTSYSVLVSEQYLR